MTIRKAEASELDALVSIDDEASELFTAAGLVVAFEADHPFVVAERERWRDAIARGLLHVAVLDDGTIAGFAALGFVDGEPYLDQLAVLPSRMRRGFGGRLLRHAIEWAEGTGASTFWLTTYAHVAWNRPYYERAGFHVRDEASCGPELRDVLRRQREALPAPEQRIAMARRLTR